MSGLEPRILNAGGILVPGAQLLSKPFSQDRLMGVLELSRRKGRPWAELAAAFERA